MGRVFLCSRVTPERVMDPRETALFYRKTPVSSRELQMGAPVSPQRVSQALLSRPSCMTPAEAYLMELKGHPRSSAGSNAHPSCLAAAASSQDRARLDIGTCVSRKPLVLHNRETTHSAADRAYVRPTPRSSPRGDTLCNLARNCLAGVRIATIPVAQLSAAFGGILAGSPETA
jgi:hypothetical protein